MSITFNCPCGKSLRVADEHAGKRIKCPACQAVNTAPKPEPAFEVVEDESEETPAPVPAKPRPAPKPAAKPAKPAARDEDEDPGFTIEEDEDEKPKPKKKPTFSKGQRRDEDDDDDEDERPKKKMKRRRDEDDDDDDERPRRRRSSNSDAGKKIMYLIGGAVLALAGVAIAVFWWHDGPHTGRRPYSGYILGGACVVAGIGTAIKGLTGNFDDDE